MNEIVTETEDKQKTQLLAVLSALPQPTAVIDQHGNIVAHNDAFLALSDQAFPNPIGHAISQYLTPQNAARIDNQLKAGKKADDASNEDDNQEQLHISSLPGPDLLHLCQVTNLKIPSISRLRFFMEHTDQGAWDFDTRTNTFVVSNAWRRMRGISLDEDINTEGHAWLADIHEDDREVLQNVFTAQTRGESQSIKIQYRRWHKKDEHWVWILCQARIMEVDEDCKPLRIVGTDTDISSVKQAETDLLQLTNKLQLAIEASGMGIWEFDPSNTKVHWDDRMLEIYGLDDGQNDRSDDIWGTFIHPDDVEDTLAYSDKCNRENLDFRRDYRIVRPDGEMRHIRSLARFVSSQDTRRKLIGVNIDITEDYMRAAELEKARRQLEYDSRHDALTGLANRRRLDKVTQDMYDTLGPYDRYAVLHLDLDHFKDINDTLGHGAGDSVLIRLTNRLSNIIKSDALVSRVGGDEFVVLFTKAPQEKYLIATCNTILTAFQEPIIVDGHSCIVGVSIGVAIGTGPPKNPSQVFIDADAALYAAKESGRSCYRIFDESVRFRAKHAADARQKLLDAMANDEITCHYQPQFDAKTLTINGAEALLRWECPNRGILLPEQFLPLAQEAGLMDRIDEQVFSRVIALQTQWHKQGIVYPTISLNISQQRLRDSEMMNQVRDLIKPHHAISFELLETAFMDKLADKTQMHVDTLKEMGIRIELDDFGSGHASIVAMQTIKPKRVKIDQRLVEPINTNPNQLLMLRSLTTVARLAGCEVVIEGIDTSVHLAAIRNVNCEVLQGHALKMPIPMAEFEQLISYQDTVISSR